MARLNQFCFSSGVTIRAEGDEGDVVHRPKAPDKAGVRQAETRRAGQVWPNLAMKRSKRPSRIRKVEPMSRRPSPKILLLLLAGFVPAIASASLAQDVSALAESLSARLLFVTSGGYWEEAGDATETETQTAEPVSPSAEAAPPKRGYYRLIAIRGADNSSQVHLQQIALTPQGPELALSIGVDEINSLGGYVTDIRPEDSTGAASGPGFAAYIYLKTDPKVIEPDTWSLYVDEFGDIHVERSSN